MAIQAGSTAASRTTGQTAAGGSAAEQAYRDAVKKLGQAQKALTQHVAGGASEQTIQADQAAVQLAAAAVAQAAAAVAREQQAQQASAQRSEPARSSPAATAARDVAATGSIDVYT